MFFCQIFGAVCGFVQLPGPTWGVMPHLGQPGPLVKRDPDPRWGSRAAGEARGRPEML